MCDFVVDACGPGSLGCNERDDHDMTPFHLACECGHIAVVVSDARPNGDEGAAPTRDAPAFAAPLPKRNFTSSADIVVPLFFARLARARER